MKCPDSASENQRRLDQPVENKGGGPGIPEQAKPKKRPEEKEEKGFYDAYAKIAETFRAWLVAYGIGAPVLLVSQDVTAAALKKLPDSKWVLLAFLCGCLLQVFCAWLNKLSMWWAYLEEMGTISEASLRYKFVDWYTNEYWTEAVSDFVTIGLFAWATYRILFVVVT